ncbi:tyrosine-type recombinase/integrase [Vibrio owensii]|uniref:tyrosine-type recombinase/integrase n=1 Tax=Vibrio owensii TaxID=696485 RepID=UPI001FD1E584|nr:tyrosine-type recombinase/integrase [Vibrio owensii]
MKKRIEPIKSDTERQSYVNKLESGTTKETMDTLTKQRYSSASLTALTSDWNTFAQFCEINAHKALPTSEATLENFIAHLSKSKKFNTIRRSIVNLGTINTVLFNKNPSNGPIIKQILAKLSVSDIHKSKNPRPLTLDDLYRLRLALSKDMNEKNIRDLLVAHIMFDCAMKRHEVVEMSVTDIETTLTFAVINGDRYPLNKSTTELLRKWFELIDNGQYLIRSIDRHGNIADDKIDESSVHRILKRIAKLLKLPEYSSLTPQSARVGAIRHLHDDGVNINDIKHFARYKTKAMPVQYIHGEDAARNEFYKEIGHQQG